MLIQVLGDHWWKYFPMRSWEVFVLWSEEEREWLGMFLKGTVRSLDDDDVDGGSDSSRKDRLSFMVWLICPHIYSSQLYLEIALGYVYKTRNGSEILQTWPLRHGVVTWHRPSSGEPHTTLPLSLLFSLFVWEWMCIGRTWVGFWILNIWISLAKVGNMARWLSACYSCTGPEFGSHQTCWSITTITLALGDLPPSSDLCKRLHIRVLQCTYLKKATTNLSKNLVDALMYVLMSHGLFQKRLGMLKELQCFVWEKFLSSNI